MNVLLLSAVAALVAVNGFFVGAEFALVRARRPRLEALEREGARGATLALRQIDRIDSYLAACQLGITMASLGIGFLGEPAIARLLEPVLGEYFSHTVAIAIAIAISYIIVTFAHITVGEQVPKIWSIVHAEKAARWAAPPLHGFYIVSHPLTWALNSVSNGMLRLIGTNSRADFSEAGAGGEDVRLLIAESAVGGSLDPREARMLSGVFELHETPARLVMTPFHAVVKVADTTTVRTALERCLESGHTRIVIVDDERPDHIVGVAHANSLAKLVLAGDDDVPVAEAAKPSLIVPETKPIDDLLADLQRDRMTLAIVADEYGTPAGIVTVEDIVEEIVGEIADETDPVASPVRHLANGDWYARGDVSLEDLADYGIALSPSPDYTSVGGLVVDELGRLAAIGDTAETDGYSIRVESVRGTRIAAVRIRDHDPERREPSA
ncbi:MAG TPA: hemolysin family protein [Gaiellaceae bacterium]|nr:hemolysin family protein [Gaiellaceae bacterium]